MADNVIKAVFASGRRVKTAPLWRYDHGIRLQPIGLELPGNYEMHFSNSKTGEATTMLADSTGAVIPAEYLIPGTEVYAWIYLVGDSYGRTKAEIIIPVDPKAQPTDQEPTPEQQPIIEQAIDALNDAQDALEEATSHIIEIGITPEERAKLAGIEAGAEVNVVEEVRYFDVLRQEYRPLPVTNKGVNLPRNEIVPENNNDVVYVDFEIDSDENVTLSPFVEPIIDAVNVHGQTVIARVKISNDSQPDFLPLIHLDGYNIRFAGFTAAEEKLDIWYDLIQHRWRAQFKELVDWDSADNSYVWANQGSENSGKVLTVGADGAVSPQEVAGGQHIWWTDELTVSSPSAKSASVAYSLLHGPVAASSSTVSAGDYVIGPPFPENPQYGEEITGDPLWLYTVTNAGSGSSCTLKARVLIPEAVDLSAYRTADDQDAIDYQLGQAILGKLDVRQGTAHAGEFLVVGSDGNITTVTMSAWTGGSY